MKPLEIYGEQKVVSWTRIDMLLALYEKCLTHIHFAVDSAADSTAARQAALKAVQVLIQLRAGIDHQQGKLPQQMDRLLEFAQSSLLDGTADGLAASRTIVTTLHDAFAHIRDEAAALESGGHIPALGHATPREFAV